MTLPPLCRQGGLGTVHPADPSPSRSLRLHADPVLSTLVFTNPTPRRSSSHPKKGCSQRMHTGNIVTYVYLHTAIHTYSHDGGNPAFCNRYDGRVLSDIRHRKTSDV